MKVLRNGKAVEVPEPPAVDISSDAVAVRVRHLRGGIGDYDDTGDILEALAADRDRLKSQLDGCAHANAVMAWNLGAKQRWTDAIATDLEAARETLEPFATVGRIIDGPFSPALFADNDSAFSGGCAWSEDGQAKTLTWGNFRRACAVLAKLSEGS